MPSKVSEAFTLRTYPYREADLIVSFLTRDQGRLRGIARSARRQKNSFGSGLERLSLVQMDYYQKENVELVRLNSCDLVQSQFSLAGDYPSGVALDFIAELSEQLLPPHEPNEKFFRLLASVLESLRRQQGIWLPLTYFSLWAVRLSGFLEEMRIEEKSLALAKDMLAKPVSQFDAAAWSKETAQDLRRALIHCIEIHIERRLLTARVLETL